MAVGQRDAIFGKAGVALADSARIQAPLTPHTARFMLMP